MANSTIKAEISQYNGAYYNADTDPTSNYNRALAIQALWGIVNSTNKPPTGFVRYSGGEYSSYLFVYSSDRPSTIFVFEMEASLNHKINMWLSVDSGSSFTLTRTI